MLSGGSSCNEAFNRAIAGRSRHSLLIGYAGLVASTHQRRYGGYLCLKTFRCLRARRPYSGCSTSLPYEADLNSNHRSKATINAITARVIDVLNVNINRPLSRTSSLSLTSWVAIATLSLLAARPAGLVRAGPAVGEKREMNRQMTLAGGRRLFPDTWRRAHFRRLSP
jgi:hypothetical protein